MGKTKRILIILLTIAVFSSLIQSNVFAQTPYESYTYSYDGDVQISPNAYVPLYKISNFGNEALKEPEDMVTDKEGKYIYIADKGNNRIVILTKSLEYVSEIKEFTNDKGVNSFKEPQGVFVTDDGLIYVADTGNSRIVIFDKEHKFQKIIEAPSEKILPANFKYNPKSVAVDSAGRIYVISLNTNMGVLALDSQGAFEGFIGAQRVVPNFAELIWRSFMTQEQLERVTSFVPVEYSNLTIDEKGFVYVTSSNIERYSLYSSVWNRSTDSAYSPVKKINPAGTDVLRRNGFFPPVGDITFDAYQSNKSIDPSKITEVSLMNNGMYCLMDEKDNKLFTYDSSGNLLYAFGGKGEAVGLYNRVSSFTAIGDNIFVLDSQDSSITVLEKTHYGKMIDEVIGYQEHRQYDKAEQLWTNIISLNNNFDMAYLGIGKIHLEQGEYKTAMKYFKEVNNKALYSRAFNLYRQKTLEKIGIIILAAIIIAIFILAKLFGKAAKYNKKIEETKARGSLKDELVYGLFVITHPFKGFYALKNEKRASVKSASVFLALAVVAKIFSDMGSGYLINNGKATIFNSALNMLLPLILWCISNTCFTSLMDGKGTFSEVYTAVCYATIPYTLFTIPLTFISHYLIADELSIIVFIMNIALVWMVLLIFFSMMSVHDYSLGKNIIVSVLTILGIAFILFLILIFFSLVGRMISLVKSISDEIAFRS